MLMALRNRLRCLPLAVLVLAACAPATEMTGVWSEPDYKAQPSSKVLVIGIGREESSRRLFESTMAEKFKSRKLQTVVSYEIWPEEAPVEEATIRKVVEEQNIDLVSVTRLVGVDKETQVRSGRHLLHADLGLLRLLSVLQQHLRGRARTGLPAGVRGRERRDQRLRRQGGQAGVERTVADIRSAVHQRRDPGSLQRPGHQHGPQRHLPLSRG
jgi:hypothetical protein